MPTTLVIDHIDVVGGDGHALHIALTAVAAAVTHGYNDTAKGQHHKKHFDQRMHLRVLQRSACSGPAGY